MNGLHLASKEGHINVVLELLARAASVDSSTKVNCSKCNLVGLCRDTLKKLVPETCMRN